MKPTHRSAVKFVREICDEPTKGAEVGVWRGLLAQALIQSFDGLHLWMVDDWGHGCRGRLNKAVGEANMVEAAERTDPSRRTMIRGDSVASAIAITDGELDFVYLDADHSYGGVKRDIKAWLPKVRAGGLLFGHDYGTRRHHAGVVRAVNEFCHKTGRELLTRRGLIWGVTV